MTDTLNCLRAWAIHIERGFEISAVGRLGSVKVMRNAADEIERLKAALCEVLEDYESYEFWTTADGGYSRPTHNPDILRRAKKALEGKDG